MSRPIDAAQPPAQPSARLAGWLARWGNILPLLLAEFIVWIGFGALLPIMPLYFTEHGVDVRLLGIVIAAWPIARLVGEPIFGWVADRSGRRVLLMVVGLAVSAVALGLPLVLTSPLEFVLLRALAGLATAVYDPAARGFLTDATPPERRGEAFGLYGSAQMGGLLFGPAIGGLGAAAFGGFAFVFVLGALTTLVAAAAVALRVREHPVVSRARVAPAYDITEFPSGAGVGRRRPADETSEPDPAAPTTLLSRPFVAAIVLNLGGYFAGGTYEVIWSLFLKSKGAGLDLIGLTFAMFAVPVLLISPFAGRLVDRRGGFAFIVIGSLAIATAAFVYTVLPDPILVIPVIWIEATGVAVLNPALFTIVAAASPRGLSSTAQGIFGASGTVGTIVASILAGYLASFDIRYPFWVGGFAMYGFLVLGLVIGGRTIRSVVARPRLDPVATTQ
jgi:MFS family permease